MEMVPLKDRADLGSSPALLGLCLVGTWSNLWRDRPRAGYLISMSFCLPICEMGSHTLPISEGNWVEKMSGMCRPRHKAELSKDPVMASELVRPLCAGKGCSGPAG